MPPAVFLVRCGALATALAVALVLGWALLDASPAAHGEPLPSARDAMPRDAAGYARRFIHLGLFRGWAGGEGLPAANRIDARALLPGDILIGHNPRAVHGYFAHATIYLGDGEVLGHHLLHGLYRDSLRNLAWYDEVRVLRPQATPRQRELAVTRARELIGAMFRMTARRDDPRRWTCSKAVAGAWAAAGIAVDDGRFWLTPDALAAGPCPLAMTFVKPGFLKPGAMP